MKIAVFFVIALMIFGYFFWDDLFGTDPEEGGVIVVEESLDDAAVPAVGDDGAVMDEDTANRGDDPITGSEGSSAAPVEPASNENQSQPMNQGRLQAGLTELEQLDSAQEKRKLLGRIAKDFDSLEPGEVDKVVRTVAELNRSLPQSVSGLYRSESYTIRSGDNLWDICKDYNRRKGLNLEVGLVRSLNGLAGDEIFPGRALKLPSDKITIKVWKKSWLLCVFLGDTILSAYKVGLGRDGRTPGGLFVIESKLKDPDWNSKKLGRVVAAGDPDNILGTRWLGFENTPQHQGYGIHGTEIPESIGKNLSDGCIRLLNEDVEELFEVISRGTRVEII